MIWSKQVAERLLLFTAGALLVSGCGGEMHRVSAPSSVPLDTLASPRTSISDLPKVDLTPLPTPEQVRIEAPGGRKDPFGRLSGSQTDELTSLLTLTGLIKVGNQQRALVSTARGSGVICVGSDGRCSEDAPPLLPIGWSVLSIDAERGCIRLALNDEPQDPFCIA